ncbi:nucleic acid-binding, OB-fold protein [Tanacetum coccineum]
MYNFKATVTNSTTNAQFTFFTNAGEKITGHPCSELKEKYKGTYQQKLPIEIVNIIGKKHIFQIYFSPSARKRAREFTVQDILDLKLPIETQNTVTEPLKTLSTSATTKESTSKEKDILDLQPPIETQNIGIGLPTSTSTIVKESTSKDKGVPGPHYQSNNKP